MKEEADKAVSGLNGKDPEGRPLTVNEAPEKKYDLGPAYLLPFSPALWTAACFGFPQAS